MLIRGRACPLTSYRRRRAEAALLTQRHCFAPVPLLLVGCGEDRLRRERQDPWFDYYTGCVEPDAAVLILPDGHSTLFLDAGDPARVVWDGPRLAPGEQARRAFAVEAVLDRRRLRDAVLAAARAWDGRIAMCQRTREPGFQSEARTAWRADLAAAGVGVANVEGTLVRQRMVKDADEVRWLRTAIARTRDGLKAVLPRIRTVLRHEAEVAAELTCHYRRHDHGPLAFPPIVGSAVHGATLHYPFNDQPLERGRPLLIDSGATAGGYCADVTRTVPQHGRFDQPRFREVYELVLRANTRARELLRPGITLYDWNQQVWSLITAAGFTRHHGLGHHLGLDVHDPADGDLPLTAGMVVTNEPGIYLSADGFGIRIEDDLLITADGCEELTRDIPKTISGIEAWMR